MEWIFLIKKKCHVTVLLLRLHGYSIPSIMEKVSKTLALLHRLCRWVKIATWEFQSIFSSKVELLIHL